MPVYDFKGKWITNQEFEHLSPKNVFHRQLEGNNCSSDEHRDKHILFRKKFYLDDVGKIANAYITADDYYKLYINGVFVTQGPAPGYPYAYNYNTIDVSRYLIEGENIVAVHTLYQGLINRVWVSGDNRHGLLLDIVIDGNIVLSSDESFLTAIHSAYTPIGIIGYDTQFAEEYDSSAETVGFQYSDYDDSRWNYASLKQNTDYTLVPQPTSMLDFESIKPNLVVRKEGRIFIDFGSNYVGYLKMKARGRRGDKIIILCGQELNEDGTVRYEMRCNCVYKETWLLSGNDDILDQYDYKSFRYVELIIPDGSDVYDISLIARHYPFNLCVSRRFVENNDILKVWNLCVHSINYGVQEVIQDCMDREKGFYVGDGCYTALTQMVLSGDDSMVRYLIDSARLSTRAVKSTVTCLNCSFMQEIAEYPLILIFLMLWHYRLTDDVEYMRKNYSFAKEILDCYRADYEKDGLLQKLDKWCVVEWPKNYQDDYDADITEGKVCVEPHMVINAYYLKAVETVNKMTNILGLPLYRDIAEMKNVFNNAFYDSERRLFIDSLKSSHSSLISNAFAYGFSLAPDAETDKSLLSEIKRHGFNHLNLFSTFPVLLRFCRDGQNELLENLLAHNDMWLRMLREGATTTFEGWGKDCKWNTSLFHLTLSLAALYIADINHKQLFD